MPDAEPALIDKLRQMPPERLLHMLAEGDDLPDPWYDAIQAIYAERGQVLPARPSRPIVIQPVRDKKRGDALLAGVGLVVAAVLFKMIENSWIGLVLGVGVILYYGARFVRYTALSDAERAAQAADEEADKHGLNELMRSSADGDVQRVRELLDFRAVDINARSPAGATALVYAARNGHAGIVEMLLINGADPKLETNMKKSAASIARQAGHASLADKLEALT